MNCAELEATIAELPLGTLAPEEKARLDEHSAACAECRASIAQLEAAYAELGGAGEKDEPLPADLRGRIVAAAKASLAAKCASCGTPVSEQEAAVFDSTTYHVECLAKARVKTAAPERPAMSCTFCHDRLTRDASVFCATCLAPHHDECFREHRRCAAPGCSESRVVRPADPSATRPRRFRWPLALVAGTGIAALSAAALTGRSHADGKVRIDVALREGASALGERHFDVALARYEAALVVDPTNDEARRGAEKCHAELAAEAAKIPKPSSTAREVPALLGQSRAQVVAALGVPSSEEEKTSGWTKLVYRSPSATVYLDPARDAVVHAVLSEGWSFRGVQVGTHRAEALNLLGVPEKDQPDINGGHHFVYATYGLALSFDGPDETISSLVFTQKPEFRADLNGGLSTPVPPEPGSQGSMREVPSLLGKSKAEVVKLLGAPFSEETLPDEKGKGFTIKHDWIKLSYRKPTATIFIDKATEKVLLATFYTDWSFRGVHVGMHPTQVMDLLGEPDDDTLDTSGDHHFRYRSHGLLLPFEGPDKTVSMLVINENGGFAPDINGNVSTPVRPASKRVNDPEPPKK